MYIERLKTEPITRNEIQEWRRQAKRDFIQGTDTDPSKVVHEFRMGGETFDDSLSTEEMMENWNGETVTTQIGYRKPKNRSKADQTFRPYGEIGIKLADVPEMSLDDIRKRVSKYTFAYANGRDYLTGENLPESEKPDTAKVAEEVPYGTKRNKVVPDQANMEILMGLIFDDEMKAKIEKANEKRFERTNR